MPLYGNRSILQPSAAAFYGYALNPGQGIDISARTHTATSGAQWGYDTLWAQAINDFNEGKATHFCRLDSDVVPTQVNWLGVLIREQQKLDADILSVVVPIKDERGMTSTAIDDTGDRWDPRLLTMHEVHERPESFTDPDILLNTGLCVFDLSKRWVQARRYDGSLMVSHHMRNKIVRGDNGLWSPRMRSEDWEFSRDMRKAGATKLYATRKVPLYHEHPQFTNAEPWGTVKCDPNHPQNPCDSSSESDCDLDCTSGATTAAL